MLTLAVYKQVNIGKIPVALSIYLGETPNNTNYGVTV